MSYVVDWLCTRGNTMEIVVVFSLIQSTFYRVVLNGFRWYVFIYMVHCVCWFSCRLWVCWWLWVQSVSMTHRWALLCGGVRVSVVCAHLLCSHKSVSVFIFVLECIHLSECLNPPYTHTHTRMCVSGSSVWRKSV